MRYVIVLGILGLFFIGNQLNGQTAFVNIGGDLSSEEGSVSFSLGQTAYQYISGNGRNINQGVQQPYEIYVVPATGHIALKDFECNAFPNLHVPGYLPPLDFF